jgi:transcriptional regulator with XRE-family HTH domain
MDLSERIKKEREKRGIKQVDMANALNLERSNYTRLENRGNKMALEQIQAIADVIGVSMKELMGIEDVLVDTKVELNETNNDNKPIEISKRITELENIIKDKELIISFQEKKNIGNLHIIKTLIHEFVIAKAGEFNLISVKKKDDSSMTNTLINKKFNKNTVKDFLNRDNYSDIYEETIWESSFQETVRISFQYYPETTNLLYQFILANLDDTEEFRYWIDAYQSYFTYKEKLLKKYGYYK